MVVTCNGGGWDPFVGLSSRCTAGLSTATAASPIKDERHVASHEHVICKSTRLRGDLRVIQPLFVNHSIVRVKSVLTTTLCVDDFSFRAALNRLSPAEDQ